MAEIYQVEDPETGLAFYRSTSSAEDTYYSRSVKLASDAMLNAVACRIHASKLRTYVAHNISTGPNIGPELKDARARAQNLFGRASIMDFADFLEGKAEIELDGLAALHLSKLAKRIKI